jgi:hypothetical protein
MIAITPQEVVDGLSCVQQWGDILAGTNFKIMYLVIINLQSTQHYKF